jgi:hypothetical protein
MAGLPCILLTAVIVNITCFMHRVLRSDDTMDWFQGVIPQRCGGGLHGRFNTTWSKQRIETSHGCDVSMRCLLQVVLNLPCRPPPHRCGMTPWNQSLLNVGSPEPFLALGYFRNRLSSIPGWGYSCSRALQHFRGDLPWDGSGLPTCLSCLGLCRIVGCNALRMNAR